MDAVREAAVSRFQAYSHDQPYNDTGHSCPSPWPTGAGAESRVSMGVTVVGGLFFATFLTLFVVPAVIQLPRGQKKR
ncbi:MAG: efflux RND transporter permease subunit [Marinilabiliales bacterium]|nr:efflux RND transporter permease subunit [Marinilabiliales bacterium]